MGSLASACSPTWGRHGSNPSRYGWLGRTYVALADGPEVFARADSTVRLAVGSRNRVASIRFWMRAFTLTTEADPVPGQASSVTLTERAHWLLNPDTGVDPYLEDPASLWLLHWWLLSSRPCRVPTWHVAFNHMLTVFSTDTLHRRLGALADQAGWKTPSAKVINEDISCLVRMYSPDRSWADNLQAHLEDIIDRPFASLMLLSAPEDGQLRLNPGVMPARVVAYACLAYSQAIDPAARTISLARLSTDVGGPGRAFRLYSRQLTAYLQRVADTHVGIQLAESLGEPVLIFDEPAMPMGGHLLSTLYSRPGYEAPPLPAH
ncbi:DUF4007 family protein [Planomonospora sp. ID91781]|uniref:DUF4007 family protein n=1 Tax=Planomonospora sp. ID91781 TaxID=2738135 RepID=UPI0018C43779|nr:DUF4007 family protein [Planomonospora sp. ID91781]MBG0825881.1 DUF4007 family protein [Planomonospora sp. ID91781]